ncbi:MAG: DUF2796 domain-containing protein [bacterium]
MKNILNVLVCLIVSFNVLAESSREKDSHEHGAANVMLAMEGEKLQLNFEVPSESLIGFEHFPKSQDQRWYFNEAIKTLLEPSKLFSIPANAECLLVGIKVSQSLFSAEDEHGHDEKDEHGHDEKDEHGHDEKDEHGHDEKDEHGHDESDKSEIHSEFSSKYHWNCEHLDEIDSIGTQLMNIFPRIEEIRVRWITKNNQGSIELESKDDRIKGWK